MQKVIEKMEEKIQKPNDIFFVIDKVFEGLHVKKEDLTHDFEQSFLTSSDISKVLKSLITKALKLTNIDHFENLEWRMVASHLLLFYLYKESMTTRGIPYNYEAPPYNDYYDFLQEAIKYNLYDPKILDFYTKDEINEVASEINYKYDLGFDYAGMNLLSERYLIKKNSKVFELPQELFITVSLLLAVPEEQEVRVEMAKKFYHAIASRKISLATPIVLNLRKPNGNLSSCFIGAMDDSLDSIYYTLDQIAQISKNAGGCGVNISRIRASGSNIREVKKASSGVMPWIKLINDTGVAVNQQGARAGAVTVALDIWHHDIEDFLHCQTENGDLRKKAFDIFPQIVIPDLFMERVEKNEEWTLFDPNEAILKYKINLAELYGDDFREKYLFLESENLEHIKKVKAKELFKDFLKIVVETGMPYVTFKDTMNKYNPNKHCGMIGNANLCTESFSNFKPSKVKEKNIDSKLNLISKEAVAGELHTCNLISLNLSLMENYDEIDYYTRLNVRILDNTIEISTAPVLEAHKHNHEYRILGVGAMGLADWLVKHKRTFANGTELVSELFERIAYAGIDESVNLAEKRGAYPKYEGSEWQKGIIMGKDEKWFEENKTSLGSNIWSQLIKKLKTHKMRNGGLFAIAPNTSTSLLMGSTASVLPVFDKFFIDKASKGSVPVCPPFMGKDTFWYYQENKNIDQNIIINTISEIQKWTDQGISMELYLNLNLGIKAKDIYDLYFNAWRKECKTVYYVRSIALKATDDGCISCAN
ncbi:MAG: ribonucleoside-diphosphate reductase subunit alpha [Candidatus Sericytochromatia bacterium]